jgi:dTDP-4-amino-4,6-dideoxygalactose transaminase
MPSTSPQSLAASGSAIQRDAIPMLDLTRQYETIKDDVQVALERVLTSQNFIGGPELDGFERESASYLGVHASVGCASGTDALWLALQAVGVGPEACVITTPFSFFASVSSIVRCGGTPILADIDPATLNLDPDATERALKRGRSHKLRVVMPVHLYGQCANMDQFDRMVEHYDAMLVEDAAQAFGAKWRDRKAGALGKAAAFSFYPTKNLSAYGDGGCVTTDDEKLAGHIRRMRNHGSRQRYYHEEIGWNSRLDAIQAAVLRVKLKHIDEWNQARRMLACRYHGLFAGAGLVKGGAQSVGAQAPIALLATMPEAYHIYHQYVVRAFRRDELRGFLSQHGVGTEIYYPVPLHLQECFEYLGYKAGDLPESERASKEVLALPMFPELREEEQQRVVAAIAEFYNYFG